MEKNYRTILRRMGKSRPAQMLSASEERSEVLDRVIGSMDPPCVVLLRENVDRAKDEPAPASPQISEAPETLKRAHESLDALEAALREKMAEVRMRWSQRYAKEEMLRLLQTGRWIAHEGDSWTLARVGNRKQNEELFKAVALLLAGDMEKHLVMVLSRLQHLQGVFAKQWYAESVGGSFSKLLPSLELSLRSSEDELFLKMRDCVRKLTFGYFHEGIRKTAKQAWRSPDALWRGVGSPLWNPLQLWESGWRGFLEDSVDLAEGTGMEFIKWYRSKWELYLRGYAQSQIDLFGAECAS